MWPDTALLPEKLRKNPVRAVIHDILGEDDRVTVRYQMRYAWEVDLKADQVGPAPVVGMGIEVW